MRKILLFIAAWPVAAQTQSANPAPAAQAQAQIQAQPASAPSQPGGAATPQQSPVPQTENWLTGWIDVGYRWSTGPDGSLETYRSVVDLGAGPKLVGTDFTITAPHKRLFDNIHVQAYDWTDPYSTLRIDAGKQGLYTFSASWRSLAYFNNLPSYADPLLAQGIMLDEQSFDSRRHLGSFEVHILPRARFSPYLGFDHDGNATQGVTTFVTDGNEYPTPYRSTDIANLYRGGLNIVLPRMHVTLEEGGTTYRSNENNYASGLNPGNSTTPILGQTLNLTGLVQTWGIRGSSTYTRAVLTADPATWIGIYGHFGYVDPHNDVNYTQYNTGNLVLLSRALFYSGEQFLLAAVGRTPQTSGDIGWVLRPMKRLRIEQYWLTNRLHTAGSATGTDSLLGPGFTLPISAAASSFLATNYNQTETDLVFDATSRVTLRGGWRYEYGDANDLVLPPSGLLTIQNSKLRQQAGLASAAWRIFDKLRINGDVEWASSGSEYFRTSLYNYRRFRVMGRYDISPAFHLSADYWILSNNNPLAGSPYKFLSHQESLSAQWTPASKKVSVDATWEHCGYQSRIDYLDPTYLIPTLSSYREYCHDVNAVVNATLPGFLNHATVSAGGSALLTSGSRPTTYYQPIIRFSMPITSHIGWFAIWQYYDFGEAYYAYEDFQNHLVTLGLRFSR
jgi:hypothetical protein